MTVRHGPAVQTAVARVPTRVWVADRAGDAPPPHQARRRLAACMGAAALLQLDGTVAGAGLAGLALAGGPRSQGVGAALLVSFGASSLSGATTCLLLEAE